VLRNKKGLFHKKMKNKKFTSQEVILLSQHLYKDKYEQYLENMVLKQLEKIQRPNNEKQNC